MSATEALKSLLPTGLRQRLKTLLGRPNRLDPDWEILAHVGPVTTPHIVFDVGAFRGYFIHSWRKWCPSAELHAFEPTPASYRNLVASWSHDPLIHLINAGVGAAPGELELNVVPDASKGYFNSFLPAESKTWEMVEFPAEKMVKEKVKVVTLDDYCAGAKVNHIYLMKIDVQGFEMEVLKGGTKTLGFTDHILVEAGILPFYTGAPLFTDVFTYLTAHGFHLMGMRAWDRGNQVLMEGDLLFRRNDLMPAIDRSVGKTMRTIA